VNYPVWELELGGGLLIALVAITHVFVSHFAVGGGLFLVVTEHRAARRGDAAMLGWLRRHTKFFALLTLVFGAITGVGIWFTIGLVHPAATSALIHTFVFGWAIEWVFFFVEIAAAIAYLATWDRVDRRTHLAFGWIYFVAAFGSLFVISGILSFMLTPGAWLASQGFADGFFNPTFWPSVLVRTLGAIAFAGLYVAVTAWREEPGLRTRLIRWAALWAVPAVALGPIAAWLYFRSAGFDLLDATRAAIPTAAHAWWLTMAAALLAAGVLLAAALLARRWPRLVSLPLGLVLLALGFASIGGAELVRESIRKPFVIGGGERGYMYAHGLTPDEVRESRQRGLLAHARWVSAACDGADGRGEELFRIACRSCHTVSGYRAIRGFVDGKRVAAINAALGRLERLRGRMPPFPGNTEEQQHLAIYLAGLDGAIEPAAPAGEGLVARGRVVLDERCVICHADLPLRPRVAGWSEERAYETLGNLSALNPAMPDFEGTDEERRALAVYLAALGAGEVE
jgi:mono/diheme cytochrome c family protein/cytochrome bd-type quinol oxidase subunit 1